MCRMTCWVRESPARVLLDVHARAPLLICDVPGRRSLNESDRAAFSIVGHILGGGHRGRAWLNLDTPGRPMLSAGEVAHP